MTGVVVATDSVEFEVVVEEIVVQVETAGDVVKTMESVELIAGIVATNETAGVVLVNAMDSSVAGAEVGDRPETEELGVASAVVEVNSGESVVGEVRCRVRIRTAPQLVNDGVTGASVTGESVAVAVTVGLCL